MRVLIGYESMYGNTHRVADAIARGFGSDDDVTVRPVAELGLHAGAADLLIIGSPTHLHGLPRPVSRRAALDNANTKFEHHDVDAAAEVARGVREWLDALPAALSLDFATFDTRFRPPALFAGHPARKIARALGKRGATQLTRPESFFVDRHEQLRPGELDRARRWGGQLCAAAHRSARVATGM